MANIDGTGHIVFSNTLDEYGLFVHGSINEYGHIVLGRAFLIIFVETLHISDTVTKTLTRDMAEPLIISDSVLRDFNRTLLEPVVIAISKYTDFDRSVAVSVLLNPTMTMQLTREFNEPVVISISRVLELTYTELVHISDSMTKTLTRSLTELVTITDSYQGIYPFIMKKWNSALKQVQKSSSIYASKVFTKATSVKKCSNVSEPIKNSSVAPVHDNTDVSLEDGRELR